MTVTFINPFQFAPAGAASYSDAVLADLPLAYWPMQETSGTAIEDVAGSNDLTISGATVNQPGPGAASGNDKAISFDGSNDLASSNAAVNLSAAAAVTFECWFNWTSFANDGDYLLAHGTEATRSVFYLPNHSGGSFLVGHGPGYNTAIFTRPSAAAWHHLAVVHSLGSSDPTECVPYIDGSAVSYTKPNTNDGTGTFTSQILYLMTNGAGSGGFGAGKLAHVAVYASALSGARIAAHYAAMA